MGLNVKRRALKVGVLELLTGEVTSNTFDWMYARLVRKQFYSVMPQVIAAWCRRRGHHVTYATYYGQNDPAALMPDDLDIVFVAAYTQACALAYALAKIFRARRIRTVLGGPHGKSFPQDAKRYYDIVVTDCDQSTIDDILLGFYESGSIVSCAKRPLSIPLLAERKADIISAAFYRGKPTTFSVLTLLSSTGCPYACNFCTDWNNPYQLRPVDELQADLKFAAEYFPRRLIGFNDPNFGVNFDKTVNAFECVSLGKRNPIVLESSLSILKPDRLRRLRDINCVYLAPGIESWNDYSRKSGTGVNQGRQKLKKICEHFHILTQYIPALQANFIIGTDLDSGNEPIDLTIEFFQEFPNILPSLAIPIAFGGTPMRDALAAEGRLVGLPPMFFVNPMITVRAKNYDPIELIENLERVFHFVSSRRMLLRRMCSPMNRIVKIAIMLFALDYSRYTKQLREYMSILKTDESFYDFHDCRNKKVPDFYHRKLDARLGRYSELISYSEREVLLD